MQVQNIPIDKVNALSNRDKCYWKNSNNFQSFLSYDFEYKNFEALIRDRQKFNIDRNLLHEVISSQYADMHSSITTKKHFDSLLDDNCFAITTAHQPSLMTGPLYYIFKILSTIKLAKRLQADMPQYHFTPIFVIGGEDHDFEEINHFYLFNKKIEWKNQGIGSVGRLSTEGISEILNQTIEILGSKSKAIDLVSKISTIAKDTTTYGDFAFKLTHLIFDHLGLVIFRMDDARLKKAFSPIIKEEILNAVSKPLVEAQQDNLEHIGFAKQAHARDINFFYLSKHGRNRIEKEDNNYKIIDTPLTFSEAELILELERFPERFSPNVIMRPLFQELIIPNLAYIGGGGELAYWLERKPQFEHFNLPFPMLIRRTSAIILAESQKKQWEALGFVIDDLFKDFQELVQMYIDNSDNPEYSLTKYQSDLEAIFTEIEEIVVNIDPTLKKTVQSELTKSQKSIDYLENKLKKSIKQKEEIQINRIQKLKDKLFPSGLQERHDNIFEFISQYGPSLIDELLDYCDPFDKEFKVFIKEKV